MRDVRTTLDHQRAKLSEHLILHLAREIVGGRLKPGDPAPPEAELAVSFAISKPVVRESIQALANLGMLRVQQGKRTQVLEPQEWNVLAPVMQNAFLLEGRAESLTAKIYELRLALETRAAAWAAERAEPDDVTHIQELAQRLQEASRSGRIAEFLAIDRDLHSDIAFASKNGVLVIVLRNLQSHLARAWTNSRVGMQHLETLTAQHNAIVQAIQGRDGKAAAEAMEGHLLWAMQLEATRASGGNRPPDLSENRPHVRIAAAPDRATPAVSQ
ncbi:FadR family transcriptional regulator [bacterium]|nr:MAG: FadR family transcriptional regulator [bacterium]